MIKTTEVKRTPIMIKKKTNQTVDSKNGQDDSKYSKSQNRQCETENVTSKKNRSSAARVYKKERKKNIKRLFKSRFELEEDDFIEN